MRAIVLSVCLVSATATFAAERFPIAGLTPAQRPAGAPTIRAVVKPKNWDERFLFGVAQPYPRSLAWRADQGAWFTPFNRPGMTGPYDLRGWHGKQTQLTRDQTASETPQR